MARKLKYGDARAGRSARVLAMTLPNASNAAYFLIERGIHVCPKTLDGYLVCARRLLRHLEVLKEMSSSKPSESLPS